MYRTIDSFVVTHLVQKRNYLLQRYASTLSENNRKSLFFKKGTNFKNDVGHGTSDRTSSRLFLSHARARRTICICTCTCLPSQYLLLLLILVTLP